MGLLQRAVETYNAGQPLVGVYRENHEPLPPIGHTLTNANVEITLDCGGNFRRARKVEKTEPKILIPVTEDSGGRTNALAPHPLCEQLKYLTGDNQQAYALYLTQLRNWASSEYTHPMLLPILRYVEGGTLISDLMRSGVLSAQAKGGYDEKWLVRWRVNGLDETQASACWMNQTLFQAFIDYYCHKLAERAPSLCMIEGVPAPAASQHPKGIIPINGNAKLISANDSSGFTYRGRFTSDWQAASVSYVASQKAHSALRYLAAEQGVNIGGRVFLCWNPQGKTLPQPMNGLRRAGTQPRWAPSDYRQELQNTIFSIKRSAQLTGDEAAVIAAFDAATTGRLALTYYSELSVGQFLQRMHDWDARCCWYMAGGIQAPALWQIVDCAFGTQRNTPGGVRLETDEKIRRQHVQQLLNCKLNGGNFPLDMVRALTRRAAAPLSYELGVWRRITHTACAALQKYRYDTKRGGDEMSWELDKKDRSFQYGRLLAAMERAEELYYQKLDRTGAWRGRQAVEHAEESHDQSAKQRQTNAIKSLSEFRRRPWHVFERVNRQLQLAYLPRIEREAADRYRRLVDEIVSVLRSCPDAGTQKELDRPLDDIYLMGYELQRNAYFTKKDNTETEENEHGNSEQ